MKHCSQCNSKNRTHIEKRMESLNVRGEQIGIESEVRVCNSCDEAMFDEQLGSINIRNAFNKYRELNGFMSSDEIVEIRRKYGLSQRGLAALVGIGTATIARYETGAIPSKTHHELLVSLKDDNDFVQRMFHSNKDKLKRLDLERMESKIDFEQKRSEERDTVALLSKKIKLNEHPLYNGYTEFDFNKMVTVVTYFINRMDRVSKTKLMKLLFYSDFRNFRASGLSISGLAYKHLPYGPVPDHHYLMLEALSDLNYIEIEPFHNYEGEYLIPTSSPDFTILDSDELEIMMSVAEEFQNMNAESISEYSHQEKAYLETEDKEYISYEYAEELMR